MTTTIFKWPLALGGNDLRMPVGATVLTVQMQGSHPQLWAKVDATKPNEWRTFHVCGTGVPMSADARLMYVATFQMDGGALVWHVFEAPYIDRIGAG